MQCLVVAKATASYGALLVRPWFFRNLGFRLQGRCFSSPEAFVKFGEVMGSRKEARLG